MHKLSRTSTLKWVLQPPPQSSPASSLAVKYHRQVTGVLRTRELPPLANRHPPGAALEAVRPWGKLSFPRADGFRPVSRPAARLKAW